MLYACGGKRKSHGVTEFIVVVAFELAIDATLVASLLKIRVKAPPFLQFIL